MFGEHGLNHATSRHEDGPMPERGLYFVTLSWHQRKMALLDLSLRDDVEVECKRTSGDMITDGFATQSLSSCGALLLPLQPRLTLLDIEPPQFVHVQGQPSAAIHVEYSWTGSDYKLSHLAMLTFVHALLICVDRIHRATVLPASESSGDMQCGACLEADHGYQPCEDYAEILERPESETATKHKSVSSSSLEATLK
nr:hypothetical protein CFP56_28662 [Quercus suber]